MPPAPARDRPAARSPRTRERPADGLVGRALRCSCGVASVRGVVRRLDLLGDAAAVVHGVAVGARPLADLGRTGRAGGAAAATRGTGRARAGRDLARVADPGRESVAQLLRILGAEVDLVGDAVERESDGLVGRAPVEVVDENYLDFLGHCGYLTLHRN